MISNIFSKLGLVLALAYIIWFVYERITCISCWGNDIFFSIPFMAIVPASFESVTAVKYFVVLGNALLIYLFVAGLGKALSCVVNGIKK